MDKEDNSVLTWALRYQKWYSIIPIGPDKKPLVPWLKYQNEKATEEEVKAWFGVLQPPNIGIVTGKISGITVVDIEKGGEWESYPVTQTARTGNGGVHLYYRYAPGLQNKARIKELTDIRGDGGYVIAPPSKTHYMVNGEVKGGSYEWTRKEKTQPFPYGKFQLSPDLKEKSDWKAMLKGTGEGNRNQTAAQVVGKLLASLPPTDWETTAWDMTVLWNQGNTPPLPDSELRATFNSILGREVRSGKRLNKTADEVSPAEDCDIRLMSEIAGDITDDMTVSYPTGFKHFDDVFMGGLKEGDLMFITGYSGLGKSTIMQSMTYNLDKIGQPTMWFTFEVPVGELWRKFKDMGVTDNFQAYAPEKIITTNMNWVEKKILEARDRFKTKIVFIDHLGFLAMEPGNYDKTLASNLSTILSMICRRLKTLAVKEGVAIVLAGHVRKPETKKGDNAPTIHDIKDSAGVAQESDGVIVVHRKRKVGQGAEDVYESQTNVIIEKNRRTGKTKVFTVNMHSGRLMEDDEFMDKSMGL